MAEKPTMYELVGDYRELWEMGFSEEDEDTFNTTLDMIKDGIIDKADSYIAVINRFKGDIAAIEAEAARLDALKKRLKGNISRMKEVLNIVLESMEEAGEKPEIKTPLHSIKFHGVGGKQKMEITGEVPDNFKRIVYEDDTEKIREALEKGEELSFAKLLPRGRYVDIK